MGWDLNEEGKFRSLGVNWCRDGTILILLSAAGLRPAVASFTSMLRSPM